MNPELNPFLLLQLVLAGPSETKRLEQMPVELTHLSDFLRRLLPSRKFADVSVELGGTKEGLVCTFVVVAARQACVEACMTPGTEKAISQQVMHEKNLWVTELNRLPIDVLIQHVMQASRATVLFRPKALSAGRTTALDTQSNKKVMKDLRSFKKSKLIGYVETNPLQLELDGFDGYEWSLPTQIRAHPSRQRYGVSLSLMDHIPLELVDRKKPRLQLHYSGVSNSDQSQIDRACQDCTQIEAIVQIGQQTGKPAMAMLTALSAAGFRNARNVAVTPESGDPTPALT